MRPRLLEMDGFASFREPASVDFTDADYFVLVGPTGSGKSTVIDAMAFALYGTVPRWNDKRLVMYALAPTAVRGTVRLVFDADGVRYVAARELRRTKQGVQVKSARLERLLDPTATGALSDETEVLASDSQVTAAVEELLGLTFENFCQCVVLPQGEFAEFLRAKGSDRRNILMKLLGAELYQQIGREANSRAALAAERSKVLAEQIAVLGDATAESQASAADRASALRALAGRVDEVLPRLTAATAERQRAQQRCEQLAAELQMLRTVRRPDGVAAVDAALSRAQRALQQARNEETAAESADTAARDRLAVAPDRGPLEQARRRHAEHAQVLAEIPAASLIVDAAVQGLDEAARTRASAIAALESARDRQESAIGHVRAAGDDVERLENERAALAAVVVPDRLGDLDRRPKSAAEALAGAAEQLAVAEQQDITARDALAATPPRGPLQKALDLLRELDEAAAALPALHRKHKLTAAKHEAAQAARAVATVAVDAVRLAQDELAVTDRAAALRPHLAVGGACPVCEQTVATLPPPLHAPQLDAAATAVREAEAAVRAASAVETDAGNAAATASAQLSAATAQVGRLTAALDGGPTDAAVIRETLCGLDVLEADARVAGAALTRARAAHLAAQGATRGLHGEVAALRAALRTARDPLVPFGAPPLDDTDLLDAWTGLAGWAQLQADARATAVIGARTTAARALRAEAAARKAFAAAEAASASADTAHTQAVGSHQGAATALAGLERRRVELATALSGAPSDTDARELLAGLDDLATAARGTDTALRAARAARVRAGAEEQSLTRDAAAVWQVLRATRDQLVGLGAPELSDGSALSGWTALLSWAGGQADERAAALPGAQDAVLSAAQHQEETSTLLTDEFAALDVLLPPGELDGTAPVAAAAALTQARADLARIEDRRKQAADWATALDAAQTDQRVAKLLGDLLRSNKFPEWLETAALDTLVIDASVNLAELSGGQFELTHRKGEFYVIDHADADSLRSVRTLSGGETFQASLALALALSAQLSSLAAGGAAQLDSIFLDEGFGTLDAATLETVAETLENLANGDRMVGVITHVGALAERIPVRFVVHRDQRTSSVARETT